MSPAIDPGRVRGIVFDLDGTLIDSYEAIGDSLNHALAAAGLPPVTVDQVRGWVGLGLETLIARAMGPERVAKGVLDFRERYDKVCMEKTRLLHQVKETLAELERRGYRMSVATNKPSYFASRILEGLGVLRYLTCVLGPDLVEHRKPHPEMVLECMKRMGVSREETVYVGDMEVDIETARAAGVPVIVLPTGSRDADLLRAAGPDLFLPEFAHILDLLPGVPPREERRQAGPPS